MRFYLSVGARSAMRPSNPFKKRGDSSVDSIRAKVMASSTMKQADLPLVVDNFPYAQAGNSAVYRRHTLQRPLLGVGLQDLVDITQMLRHSLKCQAGVVRGPRCGWLS